MPNKTIWAQDEFEESNGDPYSDWYFGVGKDFALRNLLRKRDDPEAAVALTIDLTDLSGAVPVARAQQSPVQQATPKPERVRYPTSLRPDDVTSRSDPGKPEPYVAPPHLANLAKEDLRKLVVVAVIDDGINVANERFVDANGRSRVDFAWVQDMPLSGNVLFGSEITGTQIDTARRNFNDPSAVLSELGLIDFSRPGATALARRASHGTHMADLAAGYGRGDPGYQEAHLRRIITVQLPFLMTQETSGATYAPFLLRAIEFVLARAESMRSGLGLDRLPVVINWSYATSGGPHNGAGQIERILEAQLPSDTVPTGIQAQIVLPAGNRRLARQHAVITTDRRTKKTLTLPWRIQPGDQTSSFLEIWLPIDAVPDLEIALPGEAATTVNALQTPQLLRYGGPQGDVVARVAIDDAGSGRQRILIAVVPTEIYDSARRPAPAGTWTVTVSATLTKGQRIEAWVQRDEAPYRYRTNARQSYFDDPAYEKFDRQGRPQVVDSGSSIVKRVGTQSGIATNPASLVVAGYAMDSGDAAPYSGCGDLGSPHGPYSPDVAAISDRSPSQPGILASGTLTGTTLPINGTSVAAPQVTRLLADKMAAGEPTFEAAKGALIADAAGQDTARGLPPLPAELAGSGRLGPVGHRPFRT